MLLTAVSMFAVVVSMVAIGIYVWKRVNISEQGDTELEAKLRADDERAEDGRRRRQGLPPLVRNKPPADPPADPPRADPPPAGPPAA